MAILKNKPKPPSEDVNKLKMLKPGMPVDFQLTFPNTIKRVRSEFIGADGRKILIFKFPDEKKFGPLRDGLYTDAHIVVRLVLEETGEIVAFKAKVKAITMSPIHAVWLLFPGNLQAQSLRAEKRSQIRVPCELSQAKEKAGQSSAPLAIGMILDISVSGCRVAVARKGHEKIDHKQVNVHINAPGQDNHFNFASEIMNVRMDEVHFYYGIRFTEQNQCVDALLERLLVSL